MAAFGEHLIFSSTQGSVDFSSSLVFELGASSAGRAHIRGKDGDLVVSSSTNIVTFSSSLNFPNSASYHIKSTNSDLILSASNSIVMISGALKIVQVPTTSLLAGADGVSGSIMWDSTRKTMKIYGPLGWTPILTGTAG